MAEMVISAVAQEALSQVLSSIKERYVGNTDANGFLERMEVAQIKLEAALETSNKWNVTSVPLLRWQSKLKLAAKECDDTLRRFNQRLKEEEEMKHRVRSSSLLKRIAHTARSLVSSMFSLGNDELSASTVRRFEWFADGASDFMRNVELGGTPRRCMFFDPLLRHLLEGKATKYSFVRGSQRLLFFVQPFSPPEHGIEGGLILLLEDSIAPENNFYLGLSLRLSESTDIVGVIVRCMQQFTPHLRSTAETVKSKITQLPTQDFYWWPSSFTTRREHWDNIHTIFCQWSRPNPHCCQQYYRQYAQSCAGSSRRSSSESLPCDIYLEPVTEVHLHGYVALPAGHKRRRAVGGGKTCPMRDFPYLKLEGLFSPHASSEDLSPAVGGSATEMIDGEATQRGLYANISFEQLGEIVLPMASEYCLHGDAAATSYEMLFKSRHGGAYLRVEKTSWRMTTRKKRGGKRQEWRGNKVGWTSGVGEFLGSWLAHAPAQLQGSIADWVQKEKQLPPLEEEVTPTSIVL